MTRSYWRFLLALVALLVLTAVSAKQAALGIKNAKVAVTSPDGLNDASYSLEEPKPLAQPIELGETANFKLTFTVVDTSTGNPVLPQQAHLLFEDVKGGDVTLSVNVKPNGRASFVFNTAKPITALLSTHGTFEMTLILSTLDPNTQPLMYPFGRLILPDSILRPIPRARHDLPPREGEPAFQPQQELFHTFREDEKTVGFLKTAIGTGLVLAPWLVLLVLYTQIAPNLQYKSPPSSAYLFLACLGALEALIFYYWIGLKLYHLLPIFIPLSMISAYVGKIALGSLRSRRLTGK